MLVGMKIEGSGIVKAGTVRRSGRSTSTESSDFSRHIPADSDAAAPAVTSSAQLGSIEALLALQETPDASQGGAGAAVRHGEDLLAALEDIRDGILAGRLSAGRLQLLVQRLEERRQSSTPPRLAAILDEIDLRARVELAKLAVI